MPQSTVRFRSTMDRSQSIGTVHRTGMRMPQLPSNGKKPAAPLSRLPTHGDMEWRLYATLIPYELGGRVDLTFPADGLCCRLEIPAEWLSNGTRSCGTVNGAGQPASDSFKSSVSISDDGSPAKGGWSVGAVTAPSRA